MRPGHSEVLRSAHSSVVEPHVYWHLLKEVSLVRTENEINQWAYQKVIENPLTITRNSTAKVISQYL